VAEPYRDDTDALVERLSALEWELKELDRAAERRREVEREVETLRAHVREARARGPLEDLRIASPCSASWEEMSGDDRVRHCAHCDKDVYDVAGLTRSEALALLHEREGASLCLRMYRRADGTVLTADCPLGERTKRRRRLVLVGAGAVATLATGFAALTMGSPTVGEVAPRARPPQLDPLELEESHAVTMGSIAVPMAPPPTAAPVERPSSSPGRR
jgi:hypothetical protein